MDHQKCRICGERHPLGPCPNFGGGKPKAAVVEKPKKVEPKPKEGYDRNKAHREYMKGYMKEYMRKWRIMDKQRKTDREQGR